jgi:hypothetical protein
VELKEQTPSATPLCFPEAVLNQHLVMLGKTGAGKSSALRHVVEHLLARRKRVCIVDPKGDWWGLKVSADGKGPGFPVIMFGDFKETRGRSATDVPINAQSGRHVAELIASGNRPCVIGFRGWRTSDMLRFWIDFAAALFATNTGELFVVGDEFHNFAPKGKVLSPQAGESLHWANRLLAEGRGLGLTFLLASQRPQKVHNDTLTSCETLVAMRVIHAADRAAIKDWVDGAGDPKLGKQVLDALAGLPRGEAYVWSPEIGFGPERLAFPFFTTFDSFAPPQIQRKVSSKGWADVNLDEVKQKLARVIEEHKANDPAELKKQLAELRQALAATDRAAPVDEKAIARAVAAAEARVRGESGRTTAGAARTIAALRKGLVEAMGVIEQMKARLGADPATVDPEAVKQSVEKAVATAVVEIVRVAEGVLSKQKGELERFKREVAKSVANLQGVLDRASSEGPPAEGPVAQQMTAAVPRTRPAAPVAGSGGTATLPVNPAAVEAGLSGPEQRVLNALAFWEAVEITDPADAAVALVAGYTPGSSSYEKPRGALKKRGLITFPDPSTDKRSLTEDGRKLAAPPPAEEVSWAKLHERIRKVLDGPQVKLLDELIKVYPSALSNDDLATAAGYAPGSSSYEKPRGALRKYGLAEFRAGGVAATSLLFPEGLS